MIDKLKKVLGLIGLILICAVSFFIVKTYYPEFYYHTVSLTMAGDINGLSKYITSFGYGAFAVSLGLLVFCNIFCIPTMIEVLLGHDLIYFSKHGDRFVLMLLLVIGICAVHRWHKKRHCDEV